MKKKILNIWRWLVLSRETRQLLYEASNVRAAYNERLENISGDMREFFSFVKDESKAPVCNCHVVGREFHANYHSIKEALFIDQNAGDVICFKCNGEVNKAVIHKDEKTGELHFTVVEKGTPKEKQDSELK